MFESIQGSIVLPNWIDSRKEGAMHPVNYLFEEINRNYWGIPAKPERPARKDRELPAWRLPRFRRENDVR
jgi:hypothetical protein